MATDGHSIQPLTVHTWDAFAGLVERHNGIFGGCWCTYFHDCAERQPGYEGSRAFKKLLVEAGQAHAALVMVGDEAVAWAEYGTPVELPNIHHSKQYLAEADVTPDYRITCIFVDKRYRKHGYAKVALAGALDQIAAQGGGVVEGYPHEIGEKRMSNSFVYNGTRTMYEQAGFEFDPLPEGFGPRVEQLVNDELAADRPIEVSFLPRSTAVMDEDLIRTKVSMIPESVPEIRVVDIVGLDKQADGGTHVRSTGEVGRIRVTKTESKGKGNKRIRLEIVDA
jgi:GNAT superfamily N-acetyltransferase